MEYITDTEKLKGKVVKSAKLVDCEEALAIIFEDDTCVYLDVRFCGGDSYSIELAEETDGYNEREAGIISETEYELLKAKEKQQQAERFEKSERAQLAKLQAKYQS